MSTWKRYARSHPARCRLAGMLRGCPGARRPRCRTLRRRPALWGAAPFPGACAKPMHAYGLRAPRDAPWHSREHPPAHLGPAHELPRALPAPCWLHRGGR